MESLLLEEDGLRTREQLQSCFQGREQLERRGAAGGSDEAKYLFETTSE